MRNEFRERQLDLSKRIKEEKLLNMRPLERKSYEKGQKTLHSWIHNVKDPCYYSVNVVVEWDLLRELKFDQREDYVKGIFILLHQRMNRKIHNSFKRKPHLQIKHHCVVEHFDRKTDKMTKPHIHATLAVPAVCNNKFLSLLREICDDAFEIKLDELNSDDLSSIRSTYLKRINDNDDLIRWMGYTMKQQLEGSKYGDQQEPLSA